MMVDDAHASGVFGRNGRGTVDHFGMHGRVHIQVGTLSKALGTLGGYVAGSRMLIDYLRQRARPFIFSTSHPPAVVAASIAAVEVLLEEPEIIEQLWENTRFFKAGPPRDRVQHGRQRRPDHAGHRRRIGRGAAVLGAPVRGGRVRAEHGVPDRAARQGSSPHHHHGGAHQGRAAVRPRHTEAGRNRTGHRVNFSPLPAAGPEGAGAPADNIESGGQYPSGDRAKPGQKWALFSPNGPDRGQIRPIQARSLSPRAHPPSRASWHVLC